MTRRALLAVGALAAGVLLSGCGGAGHRETAPPASTATGSGTAGKGLSDQEVSGLEKIVSGAEGAADQAEAGGG